jgi:DNA-binding NtrC family response regulator
MKRAEVDHARRDRLLRDLLEQTLVGRSAAMRLLREQTLDLLDGDDPVLIIGAVGTGKTTVGDFIARHGSRAARPYQYLDVATCAESLVESILFGHVKGVFTGAVQDRAGIFELAADGVVYLDQLEYLTPRAQQMLLQPLARRTVRRVGDTRELPIGARLLFSVSKGLDVLQAEQRIDDALRSRLGYSITLRVPSLDERREDIDLLIESYCGLPQSRPLALSQLEDDALNLLRTLSWPGNVRDLFGCLLKIAYAARGNSVDVEMVRTAYVQTVHTTDSTSPDEASLEEGKRRLVLEACAKLRRVGVRVHYGSVANQLNVPKSTLHDWVTKRWKDDPRFAEYFLAADR